MGIVGKYGIRAKVLKKSMSSVTGLVFKTFEVEYPRIILAELNTHRMLSKNSASSRAIPFKKMLEQLHGRPVRFGEVNSGMQDKGENYSASVAIQNNLWAMFDAYLYDHVPGATLSDCISDDGKRLEVSPETAWEFNKYLTTSMSEAFYNARYHKQVYNRLTESSQMMKTVISGTEWDNFFWLRDHEAADPTIAELARVMREADEETGTGILRPDEWHLPYISTYRDGEGTLIYGDWTNEEDPIRGGFIRYQLDDAIKISCARCAAVSFRNVDYDLKKSLEVYERLVGDERKHASAFEHCATPMKDVQEELFGAGLVVNSPSFPETWEEGITHMDQQGNLWSGNLKGWRQYRKLISGENYVGEY